MEASLALDSANSFEETGLMIKAKYKHLKNIKIEKTIVITKLFIKNIDNKSIDETKMINTVIDHKALFYFSENFQDIFYISSNLKTVY